jgi:hypothetical protein
LAIFVYIYYSVFTSNVILWEKVHFKHPSNSRNMSQENMILHKTLGNSFPFKLCMEPTIVFNDALKKRQRKYGANSTVALAKSKQYIVWDISMK